MTRRAQGANDPQGLDFRLVRCPRFGFALAHEAARSAGPSGP